jgi:hypothetical protein
MIVVVAIILLAIDPSVVDLLLPAFSASSFGCNNPSAPPPALQAVGATSPQ